MMYYTEFGTSRTGGTSWEMQTKVTAGNLPDKLLTSATEAEGGRGHNLATNQREEPGGHVCVFVIGHLLNVKANSAAH